MRDEAGTTRARCALGSNSTCETGGRAMATTVEGRVGSHDNEWTSAETAAGRNVGLSLWRGVRGRCPRCGRGRLFCAFLKVDDHCSVCRLDFTGHRADALPAYFEQLYAWAWHLVRIGKAYMDQSAHDIREGRGDIDEPWPEQPVPRPQRRGEPLAFTAFVMRSERLS